MNQPLASLSWLLSLAGLSCTLTLVEHTTWALMKPGGEVGKMLPLAMMALLLLLLMLALLQRQRHGRKEKQLRGRFLVTLIARACLLPGSWPAPGLPGAPPRIAGSRGLLPLMQLPPCAPARSPGDGGRPSTGQNIRAAGKQRWALHGVPGAHGVQLIQQGKTAGLDQRVHKCTHCVFHGMDKSAGSLNAWSWPKQIIKAPSTCG